jgi:hypothetical protein
LDEGYGMIAKEEREGGGEEEEGTSG